MVYFNTLHYHVEIAKIISAYGTILPGAAQIISINNLSTIGSDFNTFTLNIYKYAGEAIYSTLDPTNDEAGGVYLCSSTGLSAFVNDSNFLGFLYSGDGYSQMVEVNVTLDNFIYFSIKILPSNNPLSSALFF